MMAVEPFDVSVCQTAGLQVAAACHWWACVAACVPLTYVTGACVADSRLTLKCVGSED